MEQPVEVKLDPMTSRLLDFIRQKDGPSKVAKRIGLKPAVFYNYEAGRNKQPSPEILKLMAQHYEDFDPLYILTGRESMGVEVSRKPATAIKRADVSTLETEYEKLVIENDYLRRERDESKQTAANYWKLLETMHERQVDFSAVSSQTTARMFDFVPERMVVRGFEQYHMKGERKLVSRTWNIPGVINFADAIID